MLRKDLIFSFYAMVIICFIAGLSEYVPMPVILTGAGGIVIWRVIAKNKKEKDK